MFKVVSKKKPNKKMFNDLIFAFNVCRFVKSNAIVLTNNNSTVGIGSGQPSRLDSCEIAVNKMKKFNHKTENLVAASDAFFPFVDGIEALSSIWSKSNYSTLWINKRQRNYKICKQYKHCISFFKN